MKKNTLKLTEKHSKVLSLCRVIKTSFADATTVYTFGACFNFYKILDNVFDGCNPYITKDGYHIITEIDGEFFDIYGLCEKSSTENARPLTEREKLIWEDHSYGTRIEEFISKRYEIDE